MNAEPMERAFKGVWIPAEIWLCKELKVMEKLFLVEITSLDNEQGCYASNAHFSEFFSVGKARCSQIISALEKKNLITIKMIREGKNIVKRIIRRTEKSLKNISKITPKAPQNSAKKAPVNKPLRVFKILNRVFNKLNDPIKYIKHPYLINAKGSNTKIFNNTKDNKILSEPEINQNLPVVASSKKPADKKPKFIGEIFGLYPAHRRGGTDQQLWKIWQQEKLTSSDADKIIDWLDAAAQSNPQWQTNANGKYVTGLTRFVRERLWLTPIPVAQVDKHQSKRNEPDFHSNSTDWANDLGL